MKKYFTMIGFWFLLLLVVIAYCRVVYGELLQDRPTDENIGICGNHCWYDLRGKNLKEWKLEDHVKPVPTPAHKVIPKPVVKELPKETKIVAPSEFNLDKFAIAVSYAETGGGKKGSAITHNNAFGIMTWDKNGKRSYKRYATLQDSYTDFKRIWRDKYGNKYPTMYAVKKWTGNDRANNWIKIVNSYYYK